MNGNNFMTKIILETFSKRTIKLQLLLKHSILILIFVLDLTDKMKRSFFQAEIVSILLYGCTTLTQTKRMEKRLDGNYTRMLRVLEAKLYKAAALRPPTTHHKIYQS